LLLPNGEVEAGNWLGGVSHLSVTFITVLLAGGFVQTCPVVSEWQMLFNISPRYLASGGLPGQRIWEV